VQLEENPSETPPRRHATATPNPDQESLLTAREIEVLQEIVNGACNAEIAESLKIAPETVKTHVKNFLPKLKARDRTQAVIIALRASLVSLPD
jgi:DNA-binding NarL/FixJ family response regulator